MLPVIRTIRPVAGVVAIQGGEMGSLVVPINRAGSAYAPGPAGCAMGLAAAVAAGSVLALGALPAAAAPTTSGVAHGPQAAGGVELTGVEQAAPALDGALRRAMVKASDAAAQDLFGGVVAISGDTALVGAIGPSATAGAGPGSAYVFVRSGTTWIEQTRLTPSDGADFDYFGHRVAISGNIAVVANFRQDIYVFPPLRKRVERASQTERAPQPILRPDGGHQWKQGGLRVRALWSELAAQSQIDRLRRVQL